MFPESTPARRRLIEEATLGVGTLLVFALFALVNYLALRRGWAPSRARCCDR